MYTNVYILESQGSRQRASPGDIEVTMTVLPLQCDTMTIPSGAWWDMSLVMWLRNFATEQLQQLTRDLSLSCLVQLILRHRALPTFVDLLLYETFFIDLPGCSEHW